MTFSKLFEISNKGWSTDYTFVHYLNPNALTQLRTYFVVANAGQIVGKRNIKVQANFRLDSLCGHSRTAYAHFFLNRKGCVKIAIGFFGSLKCFNKDINRYSVVERF